MNGIIGSNKKSREQPTAACAEFVQHLRGRLLQRMKATKLQDSAAIVNDIAELLVGCAVDRPVYGRRVASWLWCLWT